MRIDANTQTDSNIIAIAYEAHQRVIELILLFQDRLDKTKDSILIDQKRNFDDQYYRLKELEEIINRMMEAISSNKNFLQDIDKILVKIQELEEIIKKQTSAEVNKDIIDYLKELKELKPAMQDLLETQNKRETMIQKIFWGLLGISFIANIIGLLVQLGAVPMPWGH